MPCDKNRVQVDQSAEYSFVVFSSSSSSQQPTELVIRLVARSGTLSKRFSRAASTCVDHLPETINLIFHVSSRSHSINLASSAKH